MNRFTAYTISSPAKGVIENITKECQNDDNRVTKLQIKSKDLKQVITSPVNGKISYIEIIKGEWNVMMSKHHKKKMNVYVEIWIDTPDNSLLSLCFNLANEDTYSLNFKKGDTVNGGDALGYVNTYNSESKYNRTVMMYTLRFRRLNDVTIFVSKGVFVRRGDVIGCYLC